MLGAIAMMDVSSATTMLQSSEEDCHMSNGQSLNKESHLSNGFMDPRVLLDSLELAPSTESASMSRKDSETGSDSCVKNSVRPRLAFLPTGCCYDDRMKLHANADFSESPHHPEDPRRIEAIMTAFKEAGLVHDLSRIDELETQKEEPNKFMRRIAARKASKDEICLIHTNDHYEWVKSLSHKTSAELRQLTDEYDKGRKSIYVGNLTYQAALISVGGAIEICKYVVSGRVKNAIAIIRPPGHHAEYNESLGFCIFNNVPIAAKVCQTDYPDTCRKVLILDWDVHHGNGIQNIFYEDPNVLYISIHVYKNGEFYPGVPEHEGQPDGGLGMCGAGIGEGRNINIGWTDQGMGDGEYLAAFQRIVMPIAHEFDPDLVIISAGFDAAVGDDLGGCFVTPACYSQMTHMLMSLANGKVAVCLEGGYNLDAISASALSVAKTLMGEPPERMVLPPLNHEAATTLDTVQRIQSRYWNCMRSRTVPYSELKQRGTRPLSEVIRKAQKEELASACGMISLYIMRNKLVTAYKNQVLATPELQAAKKILLIIHDPPDFQVNSGIAGHAPQAQNSFVTDDVEKYTKWAISKGFGVIDVNIPKPPVEPIDADPLDVKSREDARNKQQKELLCYIWDNYLENTRASVTIMGVGDAYLGVRDFLIARDARPRIPGILSFVAGALRPVRSEADEGLAPWYKKNSLIYVSPKHACWSDPDAIKRIKKARYGRIEKADIEVQGDESGVGKMLGRYEGSAVRWIEEKVGEWKEGNWDRDGTDEEVKEGKIKGEGSADGRVEMDVEMGGVVVHGARGVRV